MVYFPGFRKLHPLPLSTIGSCQLRGLWRIEATSLTTKVMQKRKLNRASESQFSSGDAVSWAAHSSGLPKPQIRLLRIGVRNVHQLSLINC